MTHTDQILRRVEKAALAVAVVGFSIWLGVLLIALWPRDDSDPTEGSRSGVSVHRDALTGCEYLSRSFAGLTPRLDRDGKPICRRQP